MLRPRRPRVEKNRKRNPVLNIPIREKYDDNLELAYKNRTYGILKVPNRAGEVDKIDIHARSYYESAFRLIGFLLSKEYPNFSYSVEDQDYEHPMVSLIIEYPERYPGIEDRISYYLEFMTDKKTNISLYSATIEELRQKLRKLKKK